MATITSEAHSNLTKLLDGSVDDVPGVAVCVVNKNGDTLFSHAAGKRGLDNDEKLDTNSIFWIASCTKMITGIAAMQLVEKGILDLDDAEQVEELCPELANVQILDGFDTTGAPKYKNKTKAITLRMLLTHTSGFGYTFFHKGLAQWMKYEGYDDEFSGHPEDIMLQPLVAEPGTEFNYGVGIDWAGILIERAVGLPLNHYMTKNIFRPLGLKDITMVPTQQMISKRLVHMHHRNKNGSLREIDHIMVKALSENSSGLMHSGGAGCFATLSDYAVILSVLLNDGTSPTTHARILKPESITEMFKNQIPQFPNFARVFTPDARPTLTNPIPEFYPQPHDQPQGWGLTFMMTIHETATGRAKNAVHWAGLANLYWWCDKEKGVAGIIGTQILPYADGKVLGLWGNVEAEVFKGLQQQ